MDYMTLSKMTVTQPMYTLSHHRGKVFLGEVNPERWVVHTCHCKKPRVMFEHYNCTVTYQQLVMYMYGDCCNWSQYFCWEVEV